MSNTNTVPLAIRIRRRRQSLDQFDALPRHVKEAIWYAPFKAAAPAMSPDALQAAYARVMAKFPLDTEAKYGPDHPQSHSSLNRRQKTESAIAADLDF